MLTHALKRVLATIVAALTLTACQNDADMLQIAPQEESILIGVYPNSEEFLRNHPKSRSDNSFETNWEDWDTISLNNGIIIELPWNKRIASYYFDTNFANDIKKEDGWMMLMHTLNGSNVYTPGLNYIFLYNQRTGYLKFFYYYPEAYTTDNGGTWHLHFDKPQKWLNATTDIAYPLNYGNFTDWEGLNPIKESNYGFASGWNCMQLHLSYQAEIYEDNLLQILPYNNNKEDIHMSIELEGVSNGVIISKTTSNVLSDLVNSLANVAGNSAETWFNNYIKSDSNVSDESRGIVSSLVTFGATQILNMFTGAFSSTSTNKSDIDLKSSFRGSVSGNISSSKASSLKSATLNVGKKYIGTELGAWNLKTSPIVYIHPVGVLDPQSEFYDAMYYKFRSSGNYSYNIEFNPILKDHMKSYKVEIIPVRYSLNDTILNPISAFEAGNLGTSSSGNMETGDFGLVTPDELLYGNFRQKNSLYKDIFRSRNYFEGIKRHYGMEITDAAPKFVYLPDVEPYIRGGNIKFNNAQHPVRVVVTMVTEFEGKEHTTISSRTYIPKIEWDPQLLQRYNKGHVNNLNEYLKTALSSDPILQVQANQ